LSGRRRLQARIVELRARSYAAVIADLANRPAPLVDRPLGQEWILSPSPNPDGDAEGVAWLVRLLSGQGRNGVVTFGVPPGLLSLDEHDILLQYCVTRLLLFPLNGELIVP
jgi:hypothetical protein